MIYALVALAVYFLFSLPRIRKSFIQQNKINDLSSQIIARDLKIKDLNKSISDTRNNCFRYQDEIARLKSQQDSPRISIPHPPDPEITLLRNSLEEQESQRMLFQNLLSQTEVKLKKAESALHDKEDIIAKKDAILDQKNAELADIRARLNFVIRGGFPSEERKEPIASDEQDEVDVDALNQKIEELTQEILDLKEYYSDLDDHCDDLTDEVKKLKAENERLKRSMYTSDYVTELQNQIEKLQNLNSQFHHDAIYQIREETWGSLLHSRDKYDLPEFRKTQIRYPTLNPEHVFYLPSGKSFHSVPWCYTLDKTKDHLESDHIFAAMDKGLQPCSKCVDEEEFNELSH